MRRLPLVLLFAAATLLVGCETYTCEGACSQFYGADGCNQPPVNPTTTDQDKAISDCVTQCSTALYTTTEERSDLDDGNRYGMEGQSDALAFINCVAEQDYSEEAFNATCEDLQHQCPYFRW